jgi:hypothetical protein
MFELLMRQVEMRHRGIGTTIGMLPNADPVVALTELRIDVIEGVVEAVRGSLNRILGSLCDILDMAGNKSELAHDDIAETRKRYTDLCKAVADILEMTKKKA